MKVVCTVFLSAIVCTCIEIQNWTEHSFPVHLYMDYERLWYSRNFPGNFLGNTRLRKLLYSRYQSVRVLLCCYNNYRLTTLCGGFNVFSCNCHCMCGTLNWKSSIWSYYRISSSVPRWLHHLCRPSVRARCSPPVKVCPCFITPPAGFSYCMQFVNLIRCNLT